MKLTSYLENKENESEVAQPVQTAPVELKSTADGADAAPQETTSQAAPAASEDSTGKQETRQRRRGVRQPRDRKEEPVSSQVAAVTQHEPQAPHSAAEKAVQTALEAEAPPPSSATSPGPARATAATTRRRSPVRSRRPRKTETMTDGTS